MRTKIKEIISALMKLEAKGCHNVWFEYENGVFSVKIYRAETGEIVYEKSVNPAQEEAQLDELSDRIEYLDLHIVSTVHQCYKQDFVKGELSGKWEKTKSVFEFGHNATQSMLIDGSGYYIDDPDNRLLYFVDMKQLSDTMK
jgi:hypothetical protein